jgi:predicted 2-oxoglutarate/Fe(II)-dependent dioxygenase YbiX
MLTINPTINAFVTYPYVYWDNWLSEEELQNIEKYCDESGIQDGEVFSTGGKQAVDDTIRISKVGMHYPTQNNEWFFEKCIMIAEKINNQFYNYDLNGFDYFQYTVYDDVGSKYDLHADMSFGEVVKGMELPRKLSFVLFLSNKDEHYTGGDFQILLNSKESDIIKPEQKRGRIIAFPSFMLHGVTPILSGVRKSIVFWVQGPKFK